VYFLSLSTLKQDHSLLENFNPASFDNLSTNQIETLVLFGINLFRLVRYLTN